MHSKRDRPHAGVVLTGDVQRATQSSDVAPLVIMTNAVVGGLGGLYATSQSVVVTALAASLVAILGALLLLRGASRGRRNHTKRSSPRSCT